MKVKNYHIVDFSLKKEVFFVIIGSLVGAFTMFVPRIVLDATAGTQYYLMWLVFAKIVNSDSYQVGAALHFAVATMIGLVTGITLYKGKLLNVSKITNSVLFGVIAGIAVFVVFYIPVNILLLEPTMDKMISETYYDVESVKASQLQKQYNTTLLDSLFSHLIWGITLGIISTILTREFGTKYRCGICDVQFSKLQNLEKHDKFFHIEKNNKTTKIVILGGGFGGVRILQDLQKSLEDKVEIEVFLVSEDNFFLFTPMLPEMASGTLEPRHIATPIRTFCKRARFFESKISSIDLKGKNVSIIKTYDNTKRQIDYDYLVIALGSRTNYFGNKNIEKYSLTIKTLGDAITIRNRIITALENADQEDDKIARTKFLTFVVVGGGFSGVETVGEINDFVRDSVDYFYHRIKQDEIRVILVSATDYILPELGQELGKYAATSLKENGIEIIYNSKLVDMEEHHIILDTGARIESMCVIWAGGIAIDPVISNLACEHDSRGRIVVDEYLKMKNQDNVFALGDCASLVDKKTGQPYPPTAQHCIRQAKLLSKNLVATIKKQRRDVFDYTAIGSMAKIGKTNGVARIFGIKIKGIFAWLLWRQYYLSNLPTREKKIRVALDWFVSFFFKSDITRLRNITDKSFLQ